METTVKPKSNKGLIIGIILFLLIVIIIIVLVIVMRRRSANAPASAPSQPGSPMSAPSQPTPTQPTPTQPTPTQPTPTQPTPTQPTPSQPTPSQPTPTQPTPTQPTPAQPTPPQPTPCPPYAIFPSTDIYGFDIPGNPLKYLSEKQCQAQCTSNPDCQWYNFKPALNLCFLKQGTPTPTFNYGFKDTDPNSSCIQHLSNPGYDIPQTKNAMQQFNIGNAISNTTEDQCEILCDNNSACQWYSYDTTASNCYLKKGNSDATTDTGFKR